jgi:site-specific DNA recombinase
MVANPSSKPRGLWFQKPAPIEHFYEFLCRAVFLKSPSGGSPEDQLVVQFQGMIAEYERAQIAERSRRGKRHKAQQGVVNILSGAPYGYRYVKKTDTSAAYYEVLESQAGVVRMVFEMYTKQQLNIRAITRLLNQRGIPTRTGKTRWERSTVWGLLRNPAYQGKACYGKTEQRPRQRITRALRQRNGIPKRSNSSGHERPRSDWITVPVPALVSEQTFALAQEQLERNKHHAQRRTLEPTLLQGMLVCQQCGYALYRCSTRTTRRRLYYYRCSGSDAHRQLKGAFPSHGCHVVDSHVAFAQFGNGCSGSSSRLHNCWEPGRDGEQAADAYAGMIEGKARFRTALIAKQGAARRAECSVKPETMAPHAL